MVSLSNIVEIWSQPIFHLPQVVYGPLVSQQFWVGGTQKLNWASMAKLEKVPSLGQEASPGMRISSEVARESEGAEKSAMM